MPRNRRMSRKRSRKTFRAGARRIHPKNNMKHYQYRGGIRL